MKLQRSQQYRQRTRKEFTSTHMHDCALAQSSYTCTLYCRCSTTEIDWRPAFACLGKLRVTTTSTSTWERNSVVRCFVCGVLISNGRERVVRAAVKTPTPTNLQSIYVHTHMHTVHLPSLHTHALSTLGAEQLMSSSRSHWLLAFACVLDECKKHERKYKRVQ